MYDILVIGSGPGGYVAAIKAARLGAKTALVEESEFGGTCLNVGCIPTKALVQSAHLVSDIKKASEMGITVDSFSVNWNEVQARVRKVVETQRKGLAALFKANEIDVIKGHGTITSSSTVKVVTEEGEKIVEARNIILATGSEPIQLPNMPFDGKRIINSDDAIFAPELPESLLVIGGGVIGCEIACVYASFGVSVTIVEMLDSILPLVDEEISKLLVRSMKKQKIKIITGVKVEGTDVGDDLVTCHLSNGKNIDAAKVLVVVGRKARIHGNGITDLNLNNGKRFVEIDGRCATSLKNVWAIGDVTGQWFLAHSASLMGEVAVANAMGHDERWDEAIIPSGIFTSPEVGTAGMNEDDAAKKFGEVKVGRYLYRPLGRAQAASTLDGIFKVVADATTNTIVGVHILGHAATDLVAEGVLAIQKGLTLEDVAATVHTHPTYSEGFLEACTEALGIGIHSLPPRK